MCRIADTQPNPPPATRPLRRALRPLRIEETADELLVAYRPGNPGAGCFMVLWLIGWGVGVVSMVPQAFAERTPRSFAVAAVLLGVWFIVFAVMLWNFCGRDELRVSRRSVRLIRRLFVPIRDRSIPTVNVRHVGLEPRAGAGNASDALVATLAIVFRGHDADAVIRFAPSLPPEWLAPLLATIQNRLAQHTAQALAAPEADAALVAAAQDQRRRAAEEAERPQGLLATAFSWLAALVWFCAGLVFIAVTISMAVRLFYDFNWTTLILLIPLGGISLFLAIVLVGIAAGTIKSLRDLLGGRRSR